MKKLNSLGSFQKKKNFSRISGQQRIGRCENVEILLILTETKNIWKPNECILWFIFRPLAWKLNKNRSHRWKWPKWWNAFEQKTHEWCSFKFMEKTKIQNTHRKPKDFNFFFFFINLNTSELLTNIKLYNLKTNLSTSRREIYFENRNGLRFFRQSSSRRNIKNH